MTSTVLKVPLEEAEPVLKLARGGRVSQNQLTEFCVEPVFTRLIVDEERENGV